MNYSHNPNSYFADDQSNSTNNNIYAGSSVPAEFFGSQDPNFDDTNDESFQVFTAHDNSYNNDPQAQYLDSAQQPPFQSSSGWSTGVPCQEDYIMPNTAHTGYQENALSEDPRNPGGSINDRATHNSYWQVAPSRELPHTMNTGPVTFHGNAFITQNAYGSMINQGMYSVDQRVDPLQEQHYAPMNTALMALMYPQMDVSSRASWNQHDGNSPYSIARPARTQEQYRGDGVTMEPQVAVLSSHDYNQFGVTDYQGMNSIGTQAINEYSQNQGMVGTTRQGSGSWDNYRGSHASLGTRGEVLQAGGGMALIPLDAYTPQPSFGAQSSSRPPPHSRKDPPSYLPPSATGKSLCQNGSASQAPNSDKDGQRSMQTANRTNDEPIAPEHLPFQHLAPDEEKVTGSSPLAERQRVMAIIRGNLPHFMVPRNEEDIKWVSLAGEYAKGDYAPGGKRYVGWEGKTSELSKRTWRQVYTLLGIQAQFSRWGFNWSRFEEVVPGSSVTVIVNQAKLHKVAPWTPSHAVPAKRLEKLGRDFDQPWVFELMKLANGGEAEYLAKKSQLSA